MTTSPGHHHVYLYLDADDQPLYVGMTVNPKRRDQNHRRGHFASLIADRLLWGPMTHEDAQRIEAEFLLRHFPAFNKARFNGYRWPEPTEEEMRALAHVCCLHACTQRGDDKCVGFLEMAS